MTTRVLDSTVSVHDQELSSVEYVDSHENSIVTIPRDDASVQDVEDPRSLELIFGQKHNDIDCALCPTAKRACNRAWVTAKQIENWSGMPKKTLWRRLNKLEKARRIASGKDMIQTPIQDSCGVPHETTLYNLNVLNQLAMVCIGNEKLNEVSCKFSDILSEVETAGSYSILLDHRFEYDYKRKEAMDSTSNRLKWSFQSGSGMTNKSLHNRRNTMQNTMLDSTVSCIPSTEIHVYKDYKDAPPISGVYVFEVEKGLVKCGMSGNVEKRFDQLVDIKKHREASREGRVAILPVDREKLKRAETAFFSLLSGNIEGTELFKISFERALKALRRLYENNPPSMFHLTDEEKAEKELKDLEREKALKNVLGLDVSRIRQKHAYDRVIDEINFSRFFSVILEVFPKSVDKLSYGKIKNEYKHYLHLVSMLLSSKVWEEDFGRLLLDEVTAGRMGSLALRLHHVVFSYKDVLNSQAHPRRLVYHAANLILLLEDIKTLFSELVEVDEKYEGKYPGWVLRQFKEARDTSDYLLRYLVSRFVVTCAYPDMDVSLYREYLHSMGKRLHELFKEEMRTTD